MACGEVAFHAEKLQIASTEINSPSCAIISYGLKGLGTKQKRSWEAEEQIRCSIATYDVRQQEINSPVVDHLPINE